MNDKPEDYDQADYCGEPESESLTNRLTDVVLDIADTFRLLEDQYVLYGNILKQLNPKSDPAKIAMTRFLESLDLEIEGGNRVSFIKLIRAATKLRESLMWAEIAEKEADRALQENAETPIE